MRVAFYAPLKAPTHPAPSGDRRMARLLMAALAQAGHQPELASIFRSYDRAGDVQRQERLRDLGGCLAARLIRRYRKRPPEAWLTYHLYHKSPDWIGPAVAEAFSIPYLAVEASHAPKRAGGPWDIGYRGAEAAIRKARVLFAPSSEDMVCLRPLVAPGARLVALKPFLEAQRYNDAFRSRDAHRRALTGRFGSDPLLLSVAMMRPGDKLQSYRLLGQALAGLTDRPWRLLVAGDGPARAETEAALAPIAGRVAWLGRVEEADLPALYAAADLYVWPGVNEAYGMALLEAQAGGLAAVAGRTGGVPDVVADGVTGRLVPEGDARAFAAAVAAFLDDPAARRRQGDAAAAVALREHDIASAARVLDAELRWATA
jgi:glycosyltransferase involved in cell wall biosynthesis